jgi:hypothetical protein
LSAEILPFRAAAAPVPDHPPAPLAARPRGRRTYSLADMIRLCGLEAYEPRTAIDHLRLKARQQGLPLPRNTRVHGGRVISGPDAIGARSLWDALLVDDWLDRPVPPGGGLAAPVPARAALDLPRRIGVAARAAAVAQR